MAAISGDQDREAIIAGIRQELAAIHDAVEFVERDLDRLEKTRPQRPDPSRPDRYFELLVGVYEHGRHGIAPLAMTRLAESLGYDRRGLNGFLSGARATLRRHGDRFVLSPEGERMAIEYLRRETG